jgi:PAS domain S-box-containing protein
MARADAITAIRFPIRLLTVALVLTTMAFAGFGWITFDARRDVEMFRDRLSRIEELRGVIVHLDEVLTMSARMAATTEDSRWEERYHQFEPQLDAAIKETIKIGASSSNIKAATQTDAANIKLVEMENRAFTLVRAGRKEEAQTVLFSPEYETQKQIYAEGILSFVNQIRREFDERFRDDQRRDLLSIIAALVVGGISLVAWFSAARGMRRWRAQLLDSVHRRAEAEENLRETHAELEVRVKERTAELAKANEALKWKTALLEAQVNASIDGILVVDHSGKKVLQNQRATDLLGVPQHIADDDDDDKQLRWVTSVIKNSEQFTEKVAYLNAHPKEISRDEIELKDGTILDRYSSPVVGTDGKYYGRIWTFRDITERKQAEGLLRASEERYRSLFEANPLPMWIYDLETLSFLEINDAAISHYGYRREEFLSMTIADIRPTADKPALLANIAHATDHAIDNAGVWRHRKKDGSMIDVEITSHVLDYSGRRAELVLVFDITERKATEKALQEAEAKYRSIFEHSNDGIFQNTPDGRHLSVNPALARMLGFDSPEELIRGRDNIERQAYVDPAMREKFKQALEENGSITGFEYEVYRKDGAKIWVSESARIVRDGEGRALYYEGSVQDITERRRAEAELTRSQLRLADAQKMAHVGSWEWDAITNKMIWSDEEYRLFGLEPGECEASHDLFHSFVRPDAREDATRWFRAVRAMKKSARMDVRIVRPDGKERILNSWADVVLDENGDVVRVVGTSQDVTEREKAERALGASEERFQLVSRATDDAIWDWDMVGNKISFSESFGKLFGHRAGEFDSTMEFWASAIHPDDHDELMAGLNAFVASREEAWSAEYRFRCADGSYAFVFDRAYVVRDVEGKPLRMVGAMQDITESKRAEAELRESRAHLQLALQASKIGPWDWDLITNKVLYSREWKQQLGHAEHEITNDLSEFSSRLHPEDAERITATLELCMADPSKEYNVEFRMRHKDGSYRWIHTRGSLHYDATGRPVRMLGCHVDITDRRLAEEELREAKVAATLREGAERYNFLADTVPQIIWTARPDGCLDYYNKAWFDYTGLTLAQTKDWGWGLVLHPDDLQPCIERWTHSFTTGENYEIEYRFKRASDGAYRWHLGRALPMRDEQGQIVQWVGTCTDIDGAKRSKETLQAAHDELGLRVIERTSELHAAKEAAEAASRAKSEFLANMSHEIRTPMNGIIGMTDLALETQLNRDQREYLGMVKSSAHSLLGLINDILDFSKIEAGKLELELIDFSLRDCIGGMLKPLGLRADQKGLELVADIPSDVPDHFVGDSMRLRQILINLTANAIKFTERGEVVVSVNSQSIINGEGELHFSVSDTGIGIPQEKQAAIFEAFAQADGSTTRTYGGTGLGLSIASQLIQKMHGKIWLESRVGQGTTFHFTACLGVRDTPVAQVKHADPCDLAGLRALVVDDNAVNRRILREMLTNWRMNPTLAESGQAGLDEMLRAAKSGSAYQLVLLDAVMPEMDGFALAEEIQQQPALAGATVMMLSSAMPAGSAARCGALGIAGLLTKPVTQSELLDAILIAVSRDSEGGNTRDGDTHIAETGTAGSRLRILVAEDNLINRAVATGILEKEGHVLVHAATGREAVEAFSDGAFDLILMDVQMPEMDGFEATRRIRELEEATGGRITIVAMTAHAMAGDRERCLAAGMDDYVSKPLRKEDLLGALNGARVRGVYEETGTRFLYSREELLSQCDGDEELMSGLVSIFRDNTPEIIQAIGAAVEKRDAPALAAHSHKLLSSLGAFGAEHARTLARRLEKHGQENNFEGARERSTELERETNKIYVALA